MFLITMVVLWILDTIAEYLPLLTIAAVVLAFYLWSR